MAPLLPGADRRARISWCLYDWAESAFPAVILSFVFAAYFTRAVAADPISGTAAWGWAMTGSAIAIALASPVCGAIADRRGARKPWLGSFSLLCILCCFALWWIEPRADHVLMAMLLLALANFGFELATVFYNAMLPDIVSRDRLGRLSGWAWGLGYIGGLACLVIALFAFIQAETPPFGLSRETAANIRIAGPLTGAWYALFALPLFLFVPDRPTIAGPGVFRAMREGLGQLVRTLKGIRRYPGVLRFLVARMIYTDGLNTLFAFGGVYAAGTWNMPVDQVILFGIALNLAAAAGAAGFGWLDDAIGSKRTIIIALVGLLGLGAAILLVTDIVWFWGLGIALGLFFGPAQASSRALMARLAPAALRTEMFGLYAFSGKAIAFLGPALVGGLTALSGSQRIGLSVILVFFVVGLAILLPLKVQTPSDGSGNEGAP